MSMLVNETLLSIDHFIISIIVIELEHLRTSFCRVKVTMESVFYPVMHSFPTLIEASFCHN